MSQDPHTKTAPAGVGSTDRDLTTTQKGAVAMAAPVVPHAEPDPQTKPYPWADETYAHQVALTRRLAYAEFARHVITENGPGEYHCGRPGDGDCAFNLIFRPYTIILYGDLGEAIFMPSGEDSLAWLRQAHRSQAYVLEKLRTADLDHFYPGDVLTYAAERTRDCYGPEWRQALKKAKHLHEWGELNLYTWAELVTEAGGDTEMCGYGSHYRPRSLWHYEALRWFATHLPVNTEGGA